LKLDFIIYSIVTKTSGAEHKLWTPQHTFLPTLPSLQCLSVMHKMRKNCQFEPIIFLCLFQWQINSSIT
jgi:hypothetical protein